MYDKYSVSTHHISFSLPRLTLLGFSPMCVQVRGGGKRVRKKGKILSALMSSFLGNLKKTLKTKRVPPGFKNIAAINESQHNKIPSYIHIVDSSHSLK